MPTATGADPFIGREREMAELTTALDGALEGRGGLVMLAGEPGIGKTRLTEELTAIAKARGALVSWGACYEGGSAPPYWPWTQVIRSLLTEPSEAVMNALETRGAVIADIVPEIDDMLPDMQPAPEVDPTQARFRLFDSVTSFLNEVAISQPVILVIDDLHWADRSTLELLEFVARDVATRPMLLVGSYRDMELSRQHPLSETLATLARARGFRRIPLRGLGSEDVGRLVEAVGGIRPPPALIDEIHDRTEGNPFFIVEVTRDLAREAAVRGGNFDSVGSFRIPEGVREAIGIRLNRLSEECNRVLQTAAVVGREFDFALLAALSQELSEDALLDVTEEAIVAGVIRVASGTNERYEFTHALIQQTLAEELTQGRRVRLHIRIVEAMEELYVDHLDEHVVELAHHCAEAETVVGEEKVVRYSRMAGERAAAAYAWVEARAYFEQALAALGEDAPAADRAAILFGLGRSELFSLTYPDIQRGWDNVARAFDLYDGLGDSEAAVEVAKQSGGYRAMWVNGTEDVYSRALELVAPSSVDAGYLLEQHADAIRFEQSDAPKSLEALEQALAIAMHTGEKRLEYRVLMNLGWVKIADGHFRVAIQHFLRALELSRERAQPMEEMVARGWLTAVSIQTGDPDVASQHLDAALRLIECTGVKSVVSLHQYRLALLRGNLAEVDKHREVVESEHPNDSVIRMMIGIGDWHTKERSDIDERFQAARQEGQTAPSLWQRSANATVLVLGALVMDRPHIAIQAGEIARSVLSAPRLAPEIEWSAHTTAGLAAVAAGDAGEALEHYQVLKDRRGGLAGLALLFAGDRLLGLLAHTAGMPGAAVAHFEDALDFSGKAGYRLETAWICYDYAEALLDSIEPPNIEKAFTLIDDGLEITRELGLIAIEKRLGTLQVKAESMAASTPAYPHGLSAREVEVLRLLATGRTNREIAGELVISARTVERHISNLYTKIGVRNRAEATSFALARLAAPPIP